MLRDIGIPDRRLVRPLSSRRRADNASWQHGRLAQRKHGQSLLRQHSCYKAVPEVRVPARISRHRDQPNHEPTLVRLCARVRPHKKER
eukprot:3829577-Rhodomonas_salina.1